MEIRQISEEYANIAADLIETEPLLQDIKDSEVTIVYLSSDKEKTRNGRMIHAECEKIPDKYKWAVPCDFTITVYEPNVERLSEYQIGILIFHELLHVGIEKDGNEESYFVRPHDIEDFRTILERYGLNWDD